MAKKQKSQIIQLWPILSALFGVISVMMMFQPAIIIKDTETTYTGWQTAFGCTQTGYFGETILFDFSLVLFIGFVVNVAAVVFALFQWLAPKNNTSAIVAITCFVLAALCWFFQIQLLVVGDGLTLSGILNPDLAKEAMALGIGAVVGGISSALGAVACTLPVLFKK